MLREHDSCTPPWTLPYQKINEDVSVDLSRKMNFEVLSTYDTYDDQSIGMMKFEKAPNGSWVRKAERAPTQARRQGQSHLGVEKEVKIREMEGGVDLQSGHQQRGLEFDILSLQT